MGCAVFIGNAASVKIGRCSDVVFIFGCVSLFKGLMFPNSRLRERAYVRAPCFIFLGTLRIQHGRASNA